jgi:6-phosphogluconolactonase
MTRLTVEPTEEDVARAAARRIAAALEAARAQRGRADLGLAGGSTPRLAYRMLHDHLEDWNAIHLWFCDERAVGPESPDSNYAMVLDTLIAGAPIPDSQVHRVLGELGAEAAAAAYREELADVVLDLALLGMGPDGHTASLFPHHPALEATESCVAVHGAPKPPPDRITMTVPYLRAARARLILTTGAVKAEAVAAVLAGPDPAVPTSLIAGPDTELLVDPPAAAKVQS